ARAGPSVTCRLGSFALMLAFASIPPRPGSAAAPILSRQIWLADSRSTSRALISGHGMAKSRRGEGGFLFGCPCFSCVAQEQQNLREVNDKCHTSATGRSRFRKILQTITRGLIAVETPDRSRARGAPWRSKPRRRRPPHCRRRHRGA